MQVFFTMTASLEDASLSLGDSVTSFACCRQYKYYAFPALAERIAPVVELNVTSGAHPPLTGSPWASQGRSL